MTLEIDRATVRRVFQATAEATGSDLLEAARTMGEEEVIPRDCLWDYLDMHGGPGKEEVREWMDSFLKLHTIEEFERELDDMGVPQTWA